MPIATFSLNPTIDLSSETDLVGPTHKIRTANEEYEPGGGGGNVARVIAELGGRARVICPASGSVALGAPRGVLARVATVVTKDKTLRVRSPKVDTRSAVGAGDVFARAMTLALSGGRSPEEAAIFATAASAATAVTPLAKVCAWHDVHLLHRLVKKDHASGKKQKRAA